MIGWIGLILLLFAYVLLLFKPKLFIPVNIIASSLLTIHASFIHDIPFIIVNGFIVLVLIIKYMKGNKIR